MRARENRSRWHIKGMCFPAIVNNGAAYNARIILDTGASRSMSDA